MKVKCLRDVYGDGKLLYRIDGSYPTQVYNGILSAQTDEGGNYPEGYESVAFHASEEWNKDEWFRHHFEIE